MKKPIEEFIKARQELIDALQKFPETKQKDVLFGKWNLKDVVAHFSAWDIFFTNSLKLLKEDKPIPYWGKIGDFNNKEVSRRKTWNWEKVYREFIESGDNFIKEYTDVSPPLANKSYWPGKTYTPEKILKVNIHHYQKAQLPEIKKLLKEWRIR